MQWREWEKRDIEDAVALLQRVSKSLHRRGKWRWMWKVDDAVGVLRRMEEERVAELEEGEPRRRLPADLAPQPAPPSSSLSRVVSMVNHSPFEDVI